MGLQGTVVLYLSSKIALKAHLSYFLWKWTLCIRSVGWKRKGFVVKKRRFRNERIQYTCFNNILLTLVISITVTKPSRFYKILRIRALLQRNLIFCFQSALPQGVFIVNISYYYIGKRYINIIVWKGLELDSNNTQSISQKLLCILWCLFHNCCKTLNFHTLPYLMSCSNFDNMYCILWI